MNKLLLIISSALLISACTGEPQKQDPDALPNGIMQPVEGTGAVARRGKSLTGHSGRDQIHAAGWNIG